MAGQTNRDFDAEVLARISEGESLSEVCADLRDFGCPSKAWFLAKVLDDKAFADRYARARELQCSVWGDRIIKEAATSRVGEKIETDAAGAVVKITIGDCVDRSRLAVDALKWTLARLHPRQYGDRVTQQIEGPNGGPVQLQWKSRSTTPPATKA